MTPVAHPTVVSKALSGSHRSWWCSHVRARLGLASESCTPGPGRGRRPGSRGADSGSALASESLPQAAECSERPRAGARGWHTGWLGQLALWAPRPPPAARLGGVPV